MRRFVFLMAFAAAAALRAQAPKCDTPEFRQLDFWVGEWVVEADGKPVGQSRIERVLDGCLLVENWYGLDGDRGKSLNWFERADGRWHQVYVGVGWNVEYAGGLRDGAMEFAQPGKRLRLSLSPRGDGTVRQHKERQAAQGGAWSTVYDFAYRRGKVTLPEAGTGKCDNVEARQFDFWIGEWDVFGPKGRQAGTNRIESAVGGCLLVENWTGTGGGSGKSFNFFDRERKQWRQVWVAAAGSLNLAGEWRDGAIRYSGETARGNGGVTQERLTFTPSAADGSVRQFWEQSADGGKTWGVAFDGKYVRKGSR